MPTSKVLYDADGCVISSGTLFILTLVDVTPTLSVGAVYVQEYVPVRLKINYDTMKTISL
jgi:hypothetical protein